MEFIFALDRHGRYHILPNEKAERAWCGFPAGWEVTIMPHWQAHAWLSDHPYDLCLGCASAEIF